MDVNNLKDFYEHMPLTDAEKATIAWLLELARHSGMIDGAQAALVPYVTERNARLDASRDRVREALHRAHIARATARIAELNALAVDAGPAPSRSPTSTTARRARRGMPAQ